jgi:hypothetical protein
MSDKPVTIAYYYRVRWGHHDEWLRLFRRNHYPILAEQLRGGRFTDLRCHRPRFHGDGGADWTFLVTITYRDWSAAEDHSDAEIAQRLFPDQDRFRAEERRRFELIDAHWDLPLEEIDLADDSADNPRRSGLGFSPNRS